MPKPDEVLERIIEGGMYLLLWGLAILVAPIRFAFITSVAEIISGSLFVGAVLGLAVTCGVAFVLYQIGEHVFQFEAHIPGGTTHVSDGHPR